MKKVLCFFKVRFDELNQCIYITFYFLVLLNRSGTKQFLVSYKFPRHEHIHPSRLLLQHGVSCASDSRALEIKNVKYTLMKLRS